jgi:hypothetical protein
MAIPGAESLDTEAPATGGVPQVIFHGFIRGDSSSGNSYGSGNIDFAKNVTQYVTEVSWTHSVNDPYETIQLALKGPHGQLQQVIPGFPSGSTTTAGLDGYHNTNPDCEFWAVLYLPNKTADGGHKWSAIAWGKCNTQSFDIEVNDDGVLTLKVRMTFESWVSTLKKSSVFLAPGTSYIQEGYSFDFRSWADEMVTLVQGFAGVTDGVQRVFKDLFRSMLFCHLPNTLAEYTGKFHEQDINGSTVFMYGSSSEERMSAMSTRAGGLSSDVLLEMQKSMGIKARAAASKRPYLFSDMIAFVGTREDCLVYAPFRLPQMKPVTGDGLGSLGNIIPRGTQWSFFESTFFPDVQAMECFPSLEWPVYYTDGPAAMIKDSTNTTTGNANTLQAAYVELAKGRDVPFWSDGNNTKRFLTSVASIDEDTANNCKMDLTEFPAGATGKSPAPFNGNPEGMSGVDGLKAGSSRTLAGTRAVMCQVMGGAMPVLMYRMKPKMVSPINIEEMTTNLRAAHKDHLSPQQYYTLLSQEPASQRTGRNQWMECVNYYPNCKYPNGQPNWLWYMHGEYETRRINFSIDDANRVNGMYAKTPIQPDSQMELHGMLGDVLVDNNSVYKNGLRMKTVDWPFFPAGLTEDYSLAKFNKKLETLTEELFVLVGQRHLWSMGQVEVAYKPWIKAGHWTTGCFPQTHNQPVVNPQRGKKAPDFSAPGQSAGGGYPGWSGYIQNVEHSLRAMPDGRITKKTVLSIVDGSMGGFGAFFQQYGWRPESFRYTQRPFIWRKGVMVTGHLKVDKPSGITTFVEGPDPTVGGAAP